MLSDYQVRMIALFSRARLLPRAAAFALLALGTVLSGCAEMGEQVSEAVKEERNQDLLRVIDDSAIAKGEALVGRRVEILCEGESKTNKLTLMGRSPGMSTNVDHSLVTFAS